MITEVKFSESSERITKVIVNNQFEILFVNTNLHQKSVESYIDELKKKFENEPNELILLVVKNQLPDKCPDYFISPHEKSLSNALRLLGEAKDYLQNNDLNGTHLSNLPQHFWETFGEGIDGVQKVNDDFSSKVYWENYVECNKNTWGFKVINKI